MYILWWRFVGSPRQCSTSGSVSFITKHLRFPSHIFNFLALWWRLVQKVQNFKAHTLQLVRCPCSGQVHWEWRDYSLDWFGNSVLNWLFIFVLKFNVFINLRIKIILWFFRYFNIGRPTVMFFSMETTCL